MRDPIVVARWATLLFVAIVLQVGVFGQLRVAGVAADVMAGLAVSAGLICGANRGAIIGFCCGMLIDLPRLNVPLGASALAFCLAALIASFMQATVLQSGWWVSVGLVGVGTSFATLMFAAVAQLFGFPALSAPAMPITVVLVGLWAAVLSRLLLRAVVWAEGPGHRTVAE